MNINKYLMPITVIKDVEIMDRGGFPDKLPWFQNNLGACGAMATARALSRVFGFPVSTLWIYIVAKLTEESFSTEGLTAPSLIHVACSVGVIPETMLPYSDKIDWRNKEKLKAMLTNEMYNVASKYRIKGVIKLKNSIEVRTALSNWYPVIWGSTISEDFRYDEDGYVLLSGVLVGGHMMNLPNYDGGMKFKFPEFNHIDVGFINIDQTWKIKDELWGDDGKGHISFRALDEEIIVVEGKPGFKLWDDCYAFIPYEDEYQSMIKPKKVVKLTIDKLTYEADGEQKLSDSAPYIIKGRTMVPLRVVSEGLGFDVQWIEKTKEIIISDDFGSIKLKVGSREVYMKSVVQQLDWIKSERLLDVPVLIDSSSNRAFVPIRFVSEKMSCIVNWNGLDRTVSVGYF